MVEKLLGAVGLVVTNSSLFSVDFLNFSGSTEAEMTRRTEGAGTQNGAVVLFGFWERLHASGPTSMLLVVYIKQCILTILTSNWTSQREKQPVF